MARSTTKTEEEPLDGFESPEDAEDEEFDPSDEDIEDEIDDEIEDDLDEDLDEDEDDWSESDESDDEEEDSEDEEAEDLDELESEELEMLTEDELAETLVVDEAAELRKLRRAEIAMDSETGSERGSDEFLCQGCFLVLSTSQLADRRRKLCVDCAG